jgi:hypothetical protein
MAARQIAGAAPGDFGGNDGDRDFGKREFRRHLRRQPSGRAPASMEYLIDPQERGADDH